MTTLAISSPPTAVIACLCFVVSAILFGVDRPKWGAVFCSAGLAVAYWPWG